jgi:DNA invertase Pin-like site-specific DNA recombinase
MVAIDERVGQTSPTETEPAQIVVDIYCRLQSPAEEDFAEQETACCQFAESHGLMVGMARRDRGSGNELERPGLTALRRGYGAGIIQGIIVKNLDRLSRSAPHPIILQQEMEAHGVNLYCVEEDGIMNRKLIGTPAGLITELAREKARNRLNRQRR